MPRGGRRRRGEARASSTTGQAARRTANSRAVAGARGTRPAAAAAAAATVAAGAARAARDDPVGRRDARPPTFAAAAVVDRAIRAARAEALAADRSTRGGSTWADRRARTAAPRSVSGGGKVCGGTASCGCGGSSRAGGVDRQGTRTGCSAARAADSGAAAVAPLLAAAGIGDLPKPVATGSTTAAAAGGTAGPEPRRNGIRAASALTWTGPALLRCRKTPRAAVQPCRPTTVAWAPAAAPAGRASRVTPDGADARGAATSGE